MTLSLPYSQPIIAHLGLSHRHAPVQLREQLHLEGQQISKLMPHLQQQFPLSEILWLETCHRIEFFCVSYDPRFAHPTSTPLHHIFLSLYPHLSAESRHLICQHARCHTGIGAVEYLIKVVASLDSVLIGETQVTHQFKRSLELACTIGTAGPILQRLGQVALATSKKIRSSTAVGEKSLSLAQSALDLAHSVFENLSTCHIAILGSGSMAKLCCQYAASYHPQNLTILARSSDKAAKLAASHRRAYGCDLNELDDVLKVADIIIACTSSSHYLLSYDQLKSVQEQRRKAQKHHLFLCDLSVPRNIHPRISELEDTYLFHVDDLKEVIQDHFEKRKQAALNAAPLLHKAALAYDQWLKECTWKPLLLEFHRKAQAITHREIATTAKKSAFSLEHAPHLETLARSITQKLTAAFAQALRESYHSAAQHHPQPTTLPPSSSCPSQCELSS